MSPKKNIYDLYEELGKAAAITGRQRRGEDFLAHGKRVVEAFKPIVERVTAEVRTELRTTLAALRAENARLITLLNTPETRDFVEAVAREAAHQRAPST